MSKFKQVIAEFKKLIADIPTEEKFENAGEELVISEMKVGGKVEMKDAEGNVIPAPDGEYKVGEDMIEVKEGFIISINGETEAAPEEQMEEEAPAEDAPNEMADIKAMVEAQAAEIEALKAAIEEMKTAMSADTSKEDAEKFSTQLQELKDVIVKLAGIPAEFSRTNQTPEVKDAMAEKFAAMSQVSMILNKNKK